MGKNTKYFQVRASDNTIVWLAEKEYLKRLNRPGYRLGWVDFHDVYFTTPILVSIDQLQEIIAGGSV